MLTRASLRVSLCALAMITLALRHSAALAASTPQPSPAAIATATGTAIATATSTATATTTGTATATATGTATSTSTSTATPTATPQPSAKTPATPAAIESGKSSAQSAPAAAASPAVPAAASTAKLAAITGTGKDSVALSSAKREGRETPGSKFLDWMGPLRQMTPGERELNVTADDSFLDPISWSVTILKSRHQLQLYYKGHMFKTYHAVFGYNDKGAKRFEGDMRTPEGVYSIIGKYAHPRWKYFLRLNYPNYVDRRNYETMLQKDGVPDFHGQPRGPGGAVGIHGTDRPGFNRTEINWTRGCISVDNDAIVEIAHFVPVDTLVVIKP